MIQTFQNERDRKFGETLVSQGKVDPADIERALEVQASVKIRLESALIRVGAISEDNLLRELSLQYGFTVLSELEIADTQKIYKFIKDGEWNLGWFLSKEVLAWPAEEEDVLVVIARDIFAPSIPEFFRRFSPKKRLERCLCPNFLLDKVLDEVAKEHSVESLFNDEETRHLRQLAEEAPVVEFVNNLIAQAVDLNASDVHIEPEEAEFKVRFRVDGVLQDRMAQPASRFAAIASRIKLISGLDISEKRLPQDGRMTTRMGGSDMDVRVSCAPCVHGESVVLRLLPKDKDDASLGKLGLDQQHLNLLKNWSRLSSGIVLVTGPTGSGKSTTLHAALKESNDGARKIITVEDPVEIRVPNITQIQTHEEIGYTFANALRAILRQDPDVIMIGEIRDLETAEIAIQAALSGHLVFSTLHTNDALSSFTRLIDMGLEPFLVAAPIQGVQAQRLIRTLCQNCATASEPPRNFEKDLSEHIKPFVENNWKKAVGCPKCQHTGFSGRSGIYELIPVDGQLQDLIVTGATLNDLKRWVSKRGFRNLKEDGYIKASRGETAFEEVMRVLGNEEGTI